MRRFTKIGLSAPNHDVPWFLPEEWAHLPNQGCF